MMAPHQRAAAVSQLTEKACLEQAQDTNAIDLSEPRCQWGASNVDYIAYYDHEWAMSATADVLGSSTSKMVPWPLVTGKNWSSPP